LVNEVRQKIISKINKASYEKYQTKFNFAIAVHSLECWLLPLYSKEKAHLGKTKSCSKQLEHEAKRRKINCYKEHRSYDELSSPYRSSKELEKGKKLQKSLALFLDSLP